MVTVAARPPVAAGVNVTVKAQLADAATGPPARGHGVSSEAEAGMRACKEPGVEMCVMLIVAVPLLVRVTVCTGLVVLRRWSPKARLVGAKVRSEALTTEPRAPGSLVRGPPPVMVTVAVRPPVAPGVKLMLIVQLAPGASAPAPVGQGF